MDIIAPNAFGFSNLNDIHTQNEWFVCIAKANIKLIDFPNLLVDHILH